MDALETLLREAIGTHGITSINLFRNGDEVFQANVSHRPSGRFKVAQDSDPVAALTAALRAGIGMRAAHIAPQQASQFEDLLG